MECLLLLKSHAAAVTHFPPNAGAPARHSGVNSVRTGSADAGKTIVFYFLLSDALARLHSAYFFACVMHYFFGGRVVFLIFTRVSNIKVFSLFSFDVFFLKGPYYTPF